MAGLTLCRKVSVGLTAVCLVLVISGLVLVCLCTFLPYWQVNDPEAEVIERPLRFSGIWKRCLAMPSSEIYICDDYDDSGFVEIPHIIRTARVLCIISIVSAGASVVLIVPGLIFIILSLIYEKYYLKILTVIVSVVSFVLALLSGVCVLHAVTQFDIESREENPYYVSTDVSTFLRGQCLYFGWIGGGLLIGGAIVSLHPAIVGIIGLKQDRRANLPDES